MHLWANAGFQQAVYKAAVFFVRKVFRNGGSHNAAHILDVLQLLLARAHQRFQRAEMRHQVIRRLFADIGNADGEQESVQFAVLALFQLGKELFRLLFTKALQRDQLFPIQMVQIRRRTHAQLVVKQPGRSRAECFDVHALPRGKMRHAGNRLRAAARPVEAEQVNAVLPQLDQFAAACRADRRRLDIRFRRFAFAIPNDAHDFRDNVVGAAHPDLAPDAHALAADVVVVVERRALHRHAADIHRG